MVTLASCDLEFSSFSGLRAWFFSSVQFLRMMFKKRRKLLLSIVPSCFHAFLYSKSQKFHSLGVFLLQTLFLCLHCVHTSQNLLISSISLQFNQFACIQFIKFAFSNVFLCFQRVFPRGANLGGRGANFKSARVESRKSQSQQCIHTSHYSPGVVQTLHER